MLPRLFDKYELLRELGKGAFGTVYLAKQQALDRDVAIKILLPEASHDKDFIVRFQREARMAASLRHPNIVQVFNAAQVADQYYIAMEYIEGQNLREMLDSGYEPDWKESVDIAIQLLRALQHAHAKDIIHRDIKPANILVEKPRRVVLTDFSIAHMKDASRLTTTGHYLGTPEYIAPEILDGVPVSPATDIYAVGLILYEMVTGVHPFRGNSIPQVIKAQLFNVPKSPDELNPRLPRAVARAINQALLKDCSKRPQSAAEMTQLLIEARDSKVPVVSLGPVAPVAPVVKLPRPDPRLQSWPDPAATIPVESPLPRPMMSPSPASPSAETWPKPNLERAPAEPIQPGVKRAGLQSLGRLTLFTSLLAVAGLAAWHQRYGPNTLETVQQGSLVLQSDPSMLQVSLTDLATPARAGRFIPHKNGDMLRLAAGEYLVRGMQPGYRDQQARLSIRPDRVTRLLFRLQAQGASLIVHCQLPGVQLAMDDGKPQPLGQNPVTFPIELGLHRFVFTKEHYQPEEVALTFQDKDNLEHKVDLKPLNGVLAVVTKPAGSVVRLNGKKLEQKTPLKLALPPGRIELKLTHPGYHEKSDTFVLEPEQNLPKNYVLTALPPPPKPSPPPPSQPEYYPPPPPAYYPPPAPPPPSFPTL
ncbi:protein kinase [bacterium]|nr:protein kinase [bacterium]